MTWTVVYTAYNRPDAELVGAILRGHGIDVFVAADDAGGTGPELAFSSGVEVRVPDKDAARAAEVLRSGTPIGHTRRDS